MVHSWIPANSKQFSSVVETAHMHVEDNVEIGSR
eukprot:SAG11_NODE_1739_length_4338_cov_2.727294_3_plen_34_part_00